MANIEKLRAVLAKIEADPTLWDQGFWIKRTACGTAGCFAGWAVMLEGGVPHEFGAYTAMGPGVEHAQDVRMPNGMVCSVDSAGARVLDLTKDEADILFDGDNTLDDLREYVAALENGNLDEVHERIDDRRLWGDGD